MMENQARACTQSELAPATDLGGALLWLMRRQTMIVRDVIIARYSAAFGNLTRSDIFNMSCLCFGVKTINGLAEMRGISRQGAHKGVHRLVDQGFVMLTPINKKQKAVHIEFSEKGYHCWQLVNQALMKIERRIAQKYGAESLSLLESILKDDWIDTGAYPHTPQ